MMERLTTHATKPSADIPVYTGTAKYLINKLGKLYRTREEAEAHAAEDKQFWDEIRKELEE